MPREGAARFDGGWLPTPSLAGLATAMEMVPHWSAHHSRDVTARCWALLSERFTVITAPGQANLVSFVPPGDPAEDAKRLLEHDVVVRDMPGTGWLRVSCGWWTSDGDVEQLLDAL